MSRNALVLASAILLTAALATTAGAATVEVEPAECFRGHCGVDVYRFTAEPGERNRVTYHRGVVRDPGAVVRSASCRRLDDHAVSCGDGAGALAAALGDGDDTAAGAYSVDAGAGDDDVPAAVFVKGGPGNDAVGGWETAEGGSGDDRVFVPSTRPGGSEPYVYGTDLLGGDGNDVLHGGIRGDVLDGGTGRDVVDGGAGDDTVIDSDPEPAADRLAGGGGGDDLVFRRSESVTADLANQTASDGDALSGFEGVTGGTGDDVLNGGPETNRLDGNAGNDALAGEGGADVLFGAAGFDELDGGDGRDRLWAGSRTPSWSFDDHVRLPLETDAQPEPVACGPGSDHVVDTTGDLILPDCERLADGLRAYPMVLGRSRATFAVPCPSRPRGRVPCRGTLTVADARFVDIGETGRRWRRRFALRRGGGRVRIRVPRTAEILDVRLTRPSGRYPEPRTVSWRIARRR